MFGTLVVVTMLVLRVVIPVGVMFVVGEAVRRHDLAEFRRIPG